MRYSGLLILPAALLACIADSACADEKMPTPADSHEVPALQSQTPTLALPAVPGSPMPASKNSNSNLSIPAPINSMTPLQGHLARHAIGIRSLPEGREPDFIIGHFAVGIGPFLTLPVNGPAGTTALLAAKFVKKWEGKQVNPCFLKLSKLNDNSGGYYFSTRTSAEGPCGWLMPMPKRPGKDKVTPWAIYFDQ